MTVLYVAMITYFGGMLLHLAICVANDHTTNLDALSSLWWPFSLGDKLPDALQFDGDGMDPNGIR